MYSSLHYKMYPTKVTNGTIFLTNSREFFIQGLRRGFSFLLMESKESAPTTLRFELYE